MNHMESEANSGSSGGCFGRPRLLQRERKRMNAPDTGNENGSRHHSPESDFAEGSSQRTGKKRRGENEGSPGRGAENEGEAGPAESPHENTHLSKAMEGDIQQLRHRVDRFTHQVSELLEAGKAYFLDASTTFEEGIMQLHQSILETWEEDIEGLRNVDIVNEEICTRLREARDVLEKLQASASSAGGLRAAALFAGS